MKVTGGKGPVLSLVGALLLLGAVLVGAVGAAPPAPVGPPPGHTFTGFPSAPVCLTRTPDVGGCTSRVLETKDGARPLSSTSPIGLAPATIISVYNFPTSTATGAGATVAIVDAYDDPTAESDLGTFSSQYGLPACTTANGCFRKVNQTGGSGLPSVNSGWALEISLDIQWAHAIAPGAAILLVEANSASLSDLLAAEDYAGGHAGYVSNSWDATESSGERAYDSHFTHTGVSYFVAAGDSGLPAEYPSASPNVISVGGTTLSFGTSGAFQSESAWSSGGGGCSAYETATSAQAGLGTYPQVGCNGQRATPDVALDADPQSGVSVYDSTPYQGQSGWFAVGGTSASTPMWAAESASTGGTVNAGVVYGGTIPFRDITTGNNGAPALVGYDLATGRGSWAIPAGPPPALPGAPTGLTASGGSGQVSLAWGAPSGTVSSYNVYRGLTPGSESLLAPGVPSASYTDTAVAASTTYYYEVAAVNSAGTGPFSNEASATTAAPPPTPPTASFTKSCNGAVCSFTSTSTDSVATITGYAWSGGNGLTGSTASVSHTYTATGTFSVNLTVTASNNTSATATGSVSCRTFHHNLRCS